jgi:hypothetical protein
MRCLIIGCSAVIMKKIQKMSPTDMTSILVGCATMAFPTR